MKDRILLFAVIFSSLMGSMVMADNCKTLIGDPSVPVGPYAGFPNGTVLEQQNVSSSVAMSDADINAYQVLYHFTDGSKAVGLAIHYKSTQFVPTPAAGADIRFWIEINGKELAHTELLRGTCSAGPGDPSCNRQITPQDILAQIGAVPFVNNSSPLKELGCPDSASQKVLFANAVNGTSLPAWDIQIAVYNPKTNTWDNNQGSNYHLHFSSKTIAY